MKRRNFLGFVASAGGIAALAHLPRAGDVPSDARVLDDRTLARVTKCETHQCTDGFVNGTPNCPQLSGCISEGCRDGSTCEGQHKCHVEHNCPDGQACEGSYSFDPNDPRTVLVADGGSRLRHRSRLAEYLDDFDEVFGS